MFASHGELGGNLALLTRDEWMDRLNEHTHRLAQTQFARWTAVVTLGAIVAGGLRFILLENWELVHGDRDRFVSVAGAGFVLFWFLLGWTWILVFAKARRDVVRSNRFPPETVWRTVPRFHSRLGFYALLVLEAAVFAMVARLDRPLPTFFGTVGEFLLADSLFAAIFLFRSRAQRGIMGVFAFIMRVFVAGLTLDLTQAIPLEEITNEDRVRIMYPVILTLLALQFLTTALDGIREEPLQSLRRLRSDLVYRRVKTTEVARRYQEILETHSALSTSGALDN